MLRQPFGVLRDGEPIHAVPLKRSVRTGITFEDDARTLLGLVAEFEEREAAIHAGYSWQEWMNTDIRDRGAAVAHLRLSRQIEIHSHDAVARESELRQKRMSKNGV